MGSYCGMNHEFPSLQSLLKFTRERRIPQWEVHHISDIKKFYIKINISNTLISPAKITNKIVCNTIMFLGIGYILYNAYVFLDNCIYFNDPRFVDQFNEDELRQISNDCDLIDSRMKVAAIVSCALSIALRNYIEKLVLMTIIKFASIMDWDLKPMIAIKKEITHYTEFGKSCSVRECVEYYER